MSEEKIMSEPTGTDDDLVLRDQVDVMRRLLDDHRQKPRPIVATGYELELLNSMIERVRDLYEFPASVEEMLDATSDELQERAVELDMISSLQTEGGPLRRSFNTEELVKLHELLTSADTKIATLATSGDGVLREIAENVRSALALIRHPDHEGAAS